MAEKAPIRVIIKIFGVGELTRQKAGLGILKCELESKLDKFLSQIETGGRQAEVHAYFVDDILSSGSRRPIFVEVSHEPLGAQPLQGLADLIHQITAKHFTNPGTKLLISLHQYTIMSVDKE